MIVQSSRFDRIGIGTSTDFQGQIVPAVLRHQPAGEGTGLGLSISYDIITQQHGGGILLAG